MRIAVLLSGTGRTLENLLLHFPIALTISSRNNIKGNDVARLHNIPLEITKDNDRIFAILDEHKIDLVCLAGWLLHLNPPEHYNEKIINIHPSLLPKFGGKGMYGHYVHEAVLKAKEKESGCTVHYVDSIYDHGQIISQRKVSVLETDTADSLAAKVFVQECALYPEVIKVILAKNNLL